VEVLRSIVLVSRLVGSFVRSITSGDWRAGSSVRAVAYCPLFNVVTHKKLPKDTLLLHYIHIHSLSAFSNFHYFSLWSWMTFYRYWSWQTLWTLNFSLACFAIQRTVLHCKQTIIQHLFCQILLDPESATNLLLLLSDFRKFPKALSICNIS